MHRHLTASILMLLVATLAFGFGYPLVVTGLSRLFFHKQANGSLIYRNGKLAGSSLLGQEFTDAKGNPLPRYFQPRPSNAGTGYDGGSSGASNLGPSNPLLIGFVAGVNTVGLDGKPSAANPFATTADPACVPTDPQGSPVTSPAPGQKYARAADGGYVCDPNTIPERAIAYRQFNGLPTRVPVPVDTNGGSYYGVGGAHPFENPTGFMNVFDLLFVVVLPFAILFMFGRLIGKPRQAYALVAVIAVIFVAHTVVSMQAEHHGNHLLPASVSQAAGTLSPGGNMEGKETRFGPEASALMTVGTMGTTAGATDSALDSYIPVGGTGAFAGILLGEISPGGDGGGLYTILVLSLLAVFVAGLMVGRTPEFLGKKIRARR